MKFLCTGTNSGLGKYLNENLGGEALARETMRSVFPRVKKSGVDVIIHCAFNSHFPVDSTSLRAYVQDNILLTKDLLEIPHKKFVYMSSIDVYPKNNNRHTEEEVIDLGEVSGLYGISKLMAEALVQEKGRNVLILRLGALLGKTSRKNSLRRMMEDHPCVLSLSQKSTFNYVLYHDVCEFLQTAIRHHLTGIYNVASSGNISLEGAAQLLRKKKIQFGRFLYRAGKIDNDKIKKISSAFHKTSREVVREFADL